MSFAIDGNVVHGLARSGTAFLSIVDTGTDNVISVGGQDYQKYVAPEWKVGNDYSVSDFDFAYLKLYGDLLDDGNRMIVNRTNAVYSVESGDTVKILRYIPSTITGSAPIYVGTANGFTGFIEDPSIS